jgi:ClpP class serine protease
MLLLDKNFCREFRQLMAVAGEATSLLNEFKILSNQELDGVAQISITGILSSDPKIGTTYDSIVKDIEAANEDDQVKSIQLNINSPGGSSQGFMPAMLAIANSEKEVVSMVSDQAASAAYMLASQSNKIFAQHELTQIGSVGIALDYLDFSEMMQSIGIKEVSLTNSDSKFKRPNFSTEEGQAEIIKEMDKSFEIILKNMALGRDVTVDFARKNFGEGRTLTASEAMKNKMIDGIIGENNVKNKVISKVNVENLKKEEPINMADNNDVEVALAAEEKRKAQWMRYIDVDPTAVAKGLASGEAIEMTHAIELELKKNSKSLVNDYQADLSSSPKIDGKSEIDLSIEEKEEAMITKKMNSYLKEML